MDPEVSMSSTLLNAGDRISEYVLEEKIGQGGFGEVWRARHNVWKDQQVAVKIPLNGDLVRRLKKEGMIQHDLVGEGIVKTLGLDPDHEPPYLILEYIDGGSLRKVLEEEGRLSIQRALEIARTTLQVLKRAHEKGVTHGDIKPENILLEKSGRILLADFGLSQLMQEAATGEALAQSLFSREGEGISGTIAYMSPEQKDPRRKVDHRTDLYSLGLVLFEMLTGSLPEGGEVPSDLNPGVPVDVDRVFRRCYARLARRFATADEALREVEGVLQAGPLPGRRTKEPAPVTSESLLTEKEAASFLRLDIEDFRRRVQSGEIPLTRTDQGEGFRLLALALIRRRVRDEAVRTVKKGGPHHAIYAGFWIRYLAFMIDLVIFSIPAVFLAGVPATGLLLPFWLSVYGVLGHGVWGKTLGKWWLGLRVVRRPGEQMNLGIAAVRAVGKAFSWASLLMGFLVAGFHAQKRSLHDLIAETWVIHDRPQGTPPFQLPRRHRMGR